MENLKKILKKIINILEDKKDDGIIEGYVLIGGMAVAAMGLPRATHDLDFLISAEESFFKEEASRVASILGFNVTVMNAGLDDPLRNLVRFSDEGGFSKVDFIPVFWKWQNEIIKSARITLLSDGTKIPIARTEDLAVLKLKAGSPKDLIDVEELIKVANLQGNIDKKRLMELSIKAKVDKKAKRLLSKLKITL